MVRDNSAARFTLGNNVGHGSTIAVAARSTVCKSKSEHHLLVLLVGIKSSSLSGSINSLVVQELLRSRAVLKLVSTGSSNLPGVNPLNNDGISGQALSNSDRRNWREGLAYHTGFIEDNKTHPANNVRGISLVHTIALSVSLELSEVRGEAEEVIGGLKVVGNRAGSARFDV